MFKEEDRLKIIIGLRMFQSLATPVSTKATQRRGITFSFSFFPAAQGHAAELVP